MKRVFVTGINGLLGHNLCEDLLQKGYIVYGLIRNINSYLGITHKNLHLIEGQLFDDHTSRLKHINIVIHIAAKTNQNGLKYNDYWNTNCNATIQLYHAAAKCDVEKFIYISTANTIGYGSSESPGNESNPMHSLFEKSLYAKSKKEAESYLLKHQNLLPVIILNPTFMIGAFDTKPSSGKIILRGLNKKVIFLPPGGKNFVHVKDVSSAIISSISNGMSGERYLIAHKNLSYYTFYKKLNKITKHKSYLITIPQSILMSLGYLGDLLRFFKIQTSLSSINTKILCINNYFLNTKSVNTFNLKYRSIDQSITDAVNYFDNPKK